MSKVKEVLKEYGIKRRNEKVLNWQGIMNRAKLYDDEEKEIKRTVLEVLLGEEILLELDDPEKFMLKMGIEKEKPELKKSFLKNYSLRYDPGSQKLFIPALSENPHPKKYFDISDGLRKAKIMKELGSDIEMKAMFSATAEREVEERLWSELLRHQDEINGVGTKELIEKVFEASLVDFREVQNKVEELFGKLKK